VLVYVIKRSPVVMTFDYFLWGAHGSAGSAGKAKSTDCVNGNYETIRKIMNCPLRYAEFAYRTV
jgi:hypothetical protein